MSKFVDHGSSRPAMRTSKYTVLPSGENAYSASSPNGFDGMSPSMPLLNRRGRFRNDWPGAASSMSTMYNCERRPSAQLSQWRTNSLSYNRPLAFSPMSATGGLVVHSCSAHSGNTSIDSSTRLPSGDSLKLLDR